MVELVAIGDGVAATERTHSRVDRQPLAPVQSSKKRKRDRPSLDGEEDTVRVTVIVANPILSAPASNGVFKTTSTSSHSAVDGHLKFKLHDQKLIYSST